MDKCTFLFLSYIIAFFKSQTLLWEGVIFLKQKTNKEKRDYCFYQFSKLTFLNCINVSFEGYNWSRKKLNFYIPETTSTENKACGLKVEP